MTWFIVDRKADKFKTSGTTAAIIFAMVVLVSFQNLCDIIENFLVINGLA